MLVVHVPFCIVRNLASEFALKSRYPHILSLCAAVLFGLAADVVRAQSASRSHGSPPLEEISWAGRIVRLHDTMTTIERRRNDRDIERLVSAAFADARTLARRPDMLENESFRAMYAEIHQLYESYISVVAPIPLSRDEVTGLRGVALVSLGSANPGEWLGADLRLPLPKPETPADTESEIPDFLLVPAADEHVVSLEEQRMSRLLGARRGAQHSGMSYFPMIARALETYGLPEELKYVPIVESNLDPNAVSHAGAIGLWQIMPETGAMYGLSVEDLRSPSRSTTAAAKHLQRLGRIFDGDWQLALAAYNGGDGRVLNAVRFVRGSLGRQPTFWEISRYLPAETRDYVARFIATARVMGG